MFQDKSLDETLKIIQEGLWHLKDTTSMIALEHLDAIAKKYEFTLADSLQSIENILNFNDCTGIYYFEAKFNNLYAKWLIEQGEQYYNLIERREKFFFYIQEIWFENRSGNTPRLSVKRFMKHFVARKGGKNLFLDGWIPLYIGKARNDSFSSNKGIRYRIIEHIYADYRTTSDQLYSMRLNDLNSTFKDVDFRVSYVELEKFDEDYLYHLVYFIEKELRYRIKPIIGKQ
ncbi:hypothetical protein NST50_24240 [Paenibacillus sp. FSL E2-0202]|jgi:hypothetical protein|uniref:hypothetical protein n=1 Tax=unclassified Paenibacillus TaxID=185978 RepID=UPI0030EC9533